MYCFATAGLCFLLLVGPAQAQVDERHSANAAETRVSDLLVMSTQAGAEEHSSATAERNSAIAPSPPPSVYSDKWLAEHGWIVERPVGFAIQLELPPCECEWIPFLRWYARQLNRSPKLDDGLKGRLRFQGGMYRASQLNDVLDQMLREKGFQLTFDGSDVLRISRMVSLPRSKSASNE